MYLAQNSTKKSKVSTGADPITVATFAPAATENITSLAAPAVTLISTTISPLHIRRIKLTPAIPVRLIYGVPASIIILESLGN
ncbi:MAG: hypothetical protein E3J43_01395 [Candidatus Heimdallarchaeota archaeon]|nr:MAG: hypothetical protein E3J43_01395 [Candidatus Heimdallarchaeota archaeon]